MNKKGGELYHGLIVLIMVVILIGVMIGIANDFVDTPYVVQYGNNVSLCDEGNLSLESCSTDRFVGLGNIRNGSYTLPTTNYTVVDNVVCLDEVVFNNTELDLSISCYGELDDLPKKVIYKAIFGVIVLIFFLGLMVMVVKETLGKSGDF